MIKMKQLASVAVLSAVIASPAYAVPSVGSADILFVVDESGSMAGEHAWLGSMVTSLEADLAAAGVTGNNYGLVGFGATGSHDGSGYYGHDHSVGGADWGTASELSTATGGLTAYGGTEDGWQAIDWALGNYSFRSGAALNIILVTDEDRDNTSGGSSLSYSSVLGDLTTMGATLNSVVNCNFNDGSAIGVDADANAYTPDGSGGYTSSTGGTQSGYCFGSTKADYVDMAWGTGGAAWDLNILRSGGTNAQSFTEAFVDIKVEEIVEDLTVPAPATLALFGAGLLGMSFAQRRKAKTA